MLTCYRGELGPDSDEEQALRTLMDAIDCDGDLSQFSASAAAAVETGRELAERQLAALEAASQDLLCSPDIIRCRSDHILCSSMQNGTHGEELELVLPRTMSPAGDRAAFIAK